MQADKYSASIRPLLARYNIDAPDIEISDLVLDSREVAIHKGFVAVKGHSLDGRDFVPQAISLGAKVILVQCDSAREHGRIDMREQSLLINFYQLETTLSKLAADFYQRPAEQMQVVAVTGTNGKTSTVQLVTQFGHLSGKKSASIGTLGAGIYAGQENSENLDATLNTTPDALQIQRLNRQFLLNEVQQVAFEASSHALVQGRIADLKTDVAVFTNLSRDHLDYHGSMSAYAQAKRLLLKQPGLKHLVVNIDDVESTAWLKELPSQVSRTVFSMHKSVSELPENCQFCIADKIEYTQNGVSLELCTSWGTGRVDSHLLGQFNVANLMAALCVQLTLGVPFEELTKHSGQLRPVAGRMEVFNNQNGANLVVDFAHTPDALKQALLAARHHCKGALICIFGCGGDRDQGKRPLMGEAAETHADQIIITNDNSRSEEPDDIVSDILDGCRSPENILVQLDRKQAIKQAIAMAKPDDLILIAGKGHEDYQIIGNEKVPYNERHYVKNLLEGNAQ